MENRELIIAYYDLYASLLTEKQRLYFEDYYFMDYSLSEIADNYNVSRNAIYDLIKKSCTNLEEYEEKMHLYEKIGKIKNLAIDSKIKENILSILEE